MRPLQEQVKKIKVKRQKENCLVRFFLFPFSFLLLPSCFEELLHQLAALYFQNSLHDFNAMIQVVGITDMKARFDRACFFIRRAINQQLDARLNQRSGAHCARFNGRVNRRICQPVVAEPPRGFAQRHDLCVSGRIAISASAIARDGQQFLADDDAGTDGHLVACLRFTRCAQ